MRYCGKVTDRSFYQNEAMPCPPKSSGRFYCRYIQEDKLVVEYENGDKDIIARHSLIERIRYQLKHFNVFKFYTLRFRVINDISIYINRVHLKMVEKRRRRNKITEACA